MAVVRTYLHVRNPLITCLLKREMIRFATTRPGSRSVMKPMIPAYRSEELFLHTRHPFASTAIGRVSTYIPLDSMNAGNKKKKVVTYRRYCKN